MPETRDGRVGRATRTHHPGKSVALTEIDRRLLDRCLERTPGAWEDFVNRFIGLFVHVIQQTAQARSVPLNQDDVDDLVSEIFVTVLQDDFAVLRRFRGESSLATYLTVVARRITVREITIRRKAQALGHVSAHGASAHAESNLQSLPAGLDNREAVSSLLSRLPSADAEIVRRYYLNEQSYQQISVELGISENSIGPILSRARSKLKSLQVEV